MINEAVYIHAISIEELMSIEKQILELQECYLLVFWDEK